MVMVMVMVMLLRPAMLVAAEMSTPRVLRSVHA